MGRVASRLVRQGWYGCTGSLSILAGVVLGMLVMHTLVTIVYTAIVARGHTRHIRKWRSYSIHFQLQGTQHSGCTAYLYMMYRTAFDIFFVSSPLTAVRRCSNLCSC